MAHRKLLFFGSSIDWLLEFIKSYLGGIKYTSNLYAIYKKNKSQIHFINLITQNEAILLLNPRRAHSLLAPRIFNRNAPTLTPDILKITELFPVRVCKCENLLILQTTYIKAYGSIRGLPNDPGIPVVKV